MIRGLGKTYNPRRTCGSFWNGCSTPTRAVHDLNLSMRLGEVTGLLGPNGAGKSTTAAMLSGLVAPSEGDALVAGYTVRGELGEVRRRVGMCPQADVLYPTLTCEEHLALYAAIKGVAREDARDAVDARLEDVGLVPKRSARVETLSGGMRRRLQMARARGSVGGGALGRAHAAGWTPGAAATRGASFAAPPRRGGACFSRRISLRRRTAVRSRRRRERREAQVRRIARVPEEHRRERVPPDARPRREGVQTPGDEGGPGDEGAGGRVEGRVGTGGDGGGVARGASGRERFRRGGADPPSEGAGEVTMELPARDVDAFRAAVPSARRARRRGRGRGDARAGRRGRGEARARRGWRQKGPPLLPRARRGLSLLRRALKRLPIVRRKRKGLSLLRRARRGLSLLRRRNLARVCACEGTACR